MEPNKAPGTRAADDAADADTELVTETLVEEVSIDGMCGVY
jgi:mycofactocin precursor